MTMKLKLWLLIKFSFPNLTLLCVSVSVLGDNSLMNSILSGNATDKNMSPSSRGMGSFPFKFYF